MLVVTKRHERRTALRDVFGPKNGDRCSALNSGRSDKHIKKDLNDNDTRTVYRMRSAVLETTERQSEAAIPSIPSRLTVIPPSLANCGSKV